MSTSGATSPRKTVSNGRDSAPVEEKWENRAPIPGGDSFPASSARSRAEPLRVLHVINYLHVGGTEGIVLNLMKGLTDGLFEHRLCTLRGFDPDWARQVQLDGALFIPGQPGVGFRFYTLPLFRIMRAYRPHIVHSRNWGTIEAVLAARLAGVPVAVHSEHGYEIETLDGMPRRRRLACRGVYAMVDAVLTVTHDLQRYHAQQAWMALEKIRVIYNGVDLQGFSPRPELREPLRARLGLPQKSFVVGTVGRMVPIKDCTTLLRAAEILVRRGVEVRLLFAGGGPELASYQRYVEQSAELSGRVLFLGLSDNVADLLNAMDVFVLTSLREGMSNTLLEAMASGLPVVATRVGGNVELLEDGRTGWVFAPGDYKDLAERLHCLAQRKELRCQFGAAARQHAIERFSMERMLRAYRDLYLELADRRGVLAQR